ncbi:MAG: OFA family MFS transporter [Lachnospiraceae bacterium]|nr:OFA family MFS transporter [Lachnospiraceae bacterium]
MSENTKSGGWRENKWFRAAIPGLLLHCSIGTVYCWSYVSNGISDYIGYDVKTVNWAFSIAILFLGLSAAFLGNFVEKDIHKASLIATFCFSLGMAGTGFFVWLGGRSYNGGQGTPSILALIGIFLCYGVIMGIGLGTGYLSPVKTLMLWFQDRKGLATGLAVAGFGAAKAIGAPIMEALQENPKVGVVKMFYFLAAAYFVMMFLGHLLLKKPAGWHEPSSSEKKPSIMEVLKTKSLGNYIGIWLMFFLNITCGLAIISYEKQLFMTVGFVGIAGTLGAISAVFNAGGRLGFSAWADTMNDRNTIYKLIFILSIVFTAIVLITNGIVNQGQSTVLAVLVVALIFVVNAGYGGGFSNVPTLLSDHYGMGSISAIHGITLSAWGFAGIAGPQLAGLIIKLFGGDTVKFESHGKTYIANPLGYQRILIATVALYILSLVICLLLVKPTEKALAAKKAKAEAKNK